MPGPGKQSQSSRVVPCRASCSSPSQRDLDASRRGRARCSAPPRMSAPCRTSSRDISSASTWRAEDRHGFDRHAHRPAVPVEGTAGPDPAEPVTIGNDQLDLSRRRPHDLADVADRRILIVEHRQADEVAHADRLGEAPGHRFFRRQFAWLGGFWWVGWRCLGGRGKPHALQDQEQDSKQHSHRFAPAKRSSGQSGSRRRGAICRPLRDIRSKLRNLTVFDKKFRRATSAASGPPRARRRP